MTAEFLTGIVLYNPLGTYPRSVLGGEVNSDFKMTFAID